MIVRINVLCIGTLGDNNDSKPEWKEILSRIWGILPQLHKLDE